MSEPSEVLDEEQIAKRLNENKSTIEGLSNSEAQDRLAQVGFNEITSKKQTKLQRFFKTFWGPIPWLIEIAALLSLVIRHWPDFIVIMALLIVNAVIEFVQSAKAADALDALKAAMALTARTKRDGEWKDIPARELVPGDIIQLANGDIIPADCLTIQGEYVSVDQAALTGESLPVTCVVGQEIFSSSIIKQGQMTCMITATGANTFFGRTAKLVSNAGNKSHFQKSVMNIGKFLIYFVLVLAICVIGKEALLHQDAGDIAELILVLVIASIPVAMPAVLSVTMALGAMTLAKKKAIVSRLEAIEEMASVDILCSDKTGTLTKNELTLHDPILYNGTTQEELNLAAALASHMDGKDAIDTTIVGSVTPELLSQYKQHKFYPFDPVGKKTEGYIENEQGQMFYVAKGAPHVIVELSDETPEVKREALAAIDELARRGLRGLGVARGDGERHYRLLGLLSLYDPPRDDSKEVIANANQYGIEVKMVTGDDIAIGKEISKELGLGTNMEVAKNLFEGIEDVNNLPDDIQQDILKADGYARVFPEHKYAIVKTYQDNGYVVAMTGDGVNDAPALKQADVGIAVSGATDAARGAADLILVEPGLSVIIDAVEESRRIFARMISYISYRVAMTINIMLFVALCVLFDQGHSSLHAAVPLTAIMIIILALLNDVPIMTIAYDNSETATHPVKWQLKRVLTIATVMGVASVVESLIQLYIFRSHSSNIAEVQTGIFYQLIVAGPFLLFVARHKGWFFTPTYPSKQLLTAIIATQIIGFLICKFGLFVAPISLSWIVWVWIYAIAWAFIINIVKFVAVHLYRD
jgi:H+-transporting ATPase